MSMDIIHVREIIKSGLARWDVGNLSKTDNKKYLGFCETRDALRRAPLCAHHSASNLLGESMPAAHRSAANPTFRH